MKNQRFHFILRFVTLILLMGSLLLTKALFLSPAQAGPELPPRDTPAPPAPPPDGSQDSDEKDRPNRQTTGAYIELQAPGAPAGAWAIVQWQDSAGGWQTVEGWQGPVTSSRWWVHPKDFSSGPFRWQIRQGPGGNEWGSSAPFHLPSGANELRQVIVSVTK